MNKSDQYIYPKTIKECHSRIEALLKTNSFQAERINELERQVMTNAQSKTKHRLLLAEFKSFKSIIRALGREDFDID